MKKIILTILILLFLVGGVVASQPTSETYPAIAFVVSENPATNTGGAGTVTIVRHKGLVKFLTNAHVVKRGGFFRYIKFRNGKVRNFIIKRIDEKRDLALLELDYPIQTEAVPLAEKSPTKGTKVYGLGFGWNGYQSAAGTIIGYSDATKSLVSDIRSINGVSGGPILNEKAYLVGIRWGSDNKDLTNTYMVPIEDVRKFLEE